VTLRRQPPEPPPVGGIWHNPTPTPDPLCRVVCRRCGRTLGEAFTDAAGTLQWWNDAGRRGSLRSDARVATVEQLRCIRGRGCPAEPHVTHRTIAGALDGVATGVVRVRL
jgi:hypothetical protein